MSHWQNNIVGLEYVNPKKLIPNPNNIKEHDNYQRKVMNGLMEEVGWAQTVVVNKRTGMLIDGHMRVEEAIKNGEETVPVTYIDVDQDTENTLLLLYDPVGSLAKQNSDRVKKVVDAVKVKSASTRDFVNSIAKRHKADTDQYTDRGDKNEDGENVIDVPESDWIKEGDIFEIINEETGAIHKLACADNRNTELWDELLEGDNPSICVTSPPYNQKINTFKPSGMQVENTSFVDRMSESYDDDVPEGEYQQQQIEMINNICKFLRSGGSLFYNHKIRYRDKKVIHPMEWLSKINYSVRQEIIWDRGGSITLNARMFIPCDERIYWIRSGDDFVFNDETEIKSWSTIWRFAAKNDIKVSAAFPFELPYRCILASTKDGDVVFDPYSGSGTTIVAAHRTGRIGIGIEKSPDHTAKSLDRLKKEGLTIRKI